MICVFPILVAFQQQPADLNADPRLDKHVSYRTVAAPAKAAIAGLAQAAGVPLAAGGNIWPEILLLRLEDVPIRDAMVKLSHATAATWLVDNGTYYLSRTDADQARRSAGDHARLVAGFRKEFADQANALATEPPFDAAEAKSVARQLKSRSDPKANAETGAQSGISVVDFNKIQRATPSGRMMARICALLDPETLSQAPPRRRTVFSTNPTRMEAPLRIDFGDAIATFLAEQKVFASELDTYSEQDRLAIENSPQGFFGVDRSGQPPAKLNVVVSRLDDSMGGAGLEIQLYTAAGVKTASSSITVQTDPEFPSERELMADPNEQKLAVSADDTTLMQVLGSTLGGKSAKVTVLPEAIRARLLQPERNEPLAAFASSLLLATADTKHLNLVADMPDAYVILGATPGFTGLPTATSILKLAMALPPSIGPVTVDEKWIEIAGGQASPSAIMGHRADRAALGQLFASAQDGTLTVEGLARYAYVGDGVPDDFMFLLLGPLLFPGSDVSGSERWRTLKLIGSLMHRQADAPLKPGRIPVASLDPDSLSQLVNIVFYQENYGFAGPQRAHGVFLDDEPCEVMPNGLPRDSYIDVTVTDKAAVYSSGPRGEEVGPNQLAFNMEMQEHPDRYGGGRASYTTASKFRIGSIRRIQLHIQLAEGISKDLTVAEKHVGHGGEVSFSQLSKEFRDQYEQIKASYNNAGQ